MPYLPDPPRFLPLSLRIRLLFGDFLHQFGWWCLSASAIMILVCVRAPDWEEFQMTPDNMQTVTARIIAVKPYSSTENGSGFTYVYRFESLSGGERVEASVSLGGEQRYRAGGTAQIQYLRTHPLRSRFPGQPTTIWLWVSLSAVMGLLFVGLGGLCVFALGFSWQEGKDRIQLLQRGILLPLEKVECRFPDSEGASGQLHYRFTPPGAAQEVSRWVPLEPRRLRQFSPEGPWHVLYLPASPQKSQVWELWPGGLKQDARGAFLGNWRYFFYLLTPPLALALFLLLYFFQDSPSAHFF